MFGGGKGRPSIEGLPFPPPNIPSSSPKTFDLIESLMSVRAMGRTIFGDMNVSHCIIYKN